MNASEKSPLESSACTSEYRSFGDEARRDRSAQAIPWKAWVPSLYCSGAGSLGVGDVQLVQFRARAVDTVSASWGKEAGW